MKSKKMASSRLPTHIYPHHYKLQLTPDLEGFVFSGDEEITLTIDKSTDTIVLHAAELQITFAEFIHGSQKIGNPQIIYDEKNETATLVFHKKLPKGKWVLKLTFTGILNDKMRGFYRSRYEINGKEYYMATTQFESTDARRAFPSFDEPSKKAIFEVSLVIPSDHTAISNTIDSEVLEHESGLKIVNFAPTPKMSTYLLAFIVGKFEHIQATSQNKKQVRVFTTPGKKHQAKFALNMAVKCLDFFEDYFGIPYPLPVLDLIAIPDFAAGAMENWGAVTYRETALLVDEELTSTANKQWVALVVAHELAHMWFGNLVTMEWWTHLWLNEGFASYIEFLAVDHVFPQWDIWTQFVYLEHSKALDLDGLNNTHAIEIDINHPAEISEIFDAVSYSKGASLIRMLAEYLGAEDFRKGLNRYLKKHEYENAETNDLWKALESVSKKPVQKMMGNWTRKPGYPLITIEEKEDSLFLSQSRFFSSPKSKKESKDKTLWSVPISFEIESKTNSFLVFLTSKKTSMPKTPSDLWIKGNSHETSLIRISYPTSILKKLQVPIAHKTLAPEDRYGILRDIFCLSQAGNVSTDKALDLTKSYIHEDHYIVWAEIASQLSALRNIFKKESFFKNFRGYGRLIFQSIAQKVGWEKQKGESHVYTLLRSIALYNLGTYGDTATIKYAQKLFTKKINKGKNALDSDLRGVVYALVAENGGEKEYRIFRKLYNDAPFQEERDRILRALCEFRNEKLLEETLQFAFFEGRAQDAFKAISFIWSNPKGQELTWKFVQKNWEFIHQKYAGGHLFSRFIKPASHFVEERYAHEIEEFFKKHPEPGLERTISQVLEQIYANNLWLQRDKTRIKTYLETSLSLD